MSRSRLLLIPAFCALLPFQAHAQNDKPLQTTNETLTAIQRNSSTGKLEACSIRSAAKTKQGFVSSTLLFNTASGAPLYEFSSKIFKSEQETVPVMETWIEAGSLDSRKTAQLTPPGMSIQIGVMPNELIVPTLAHLRTGNYVFGARGKGWESAYAFETKPINQAELTKIANCVAAMDPRQAEGLKAAGFTITPDEQHEKGNGLKGNPPDPFYKATQFLDNPENPGGCLLQLTPITTGRKEVGGVLITTGFLGEGNAKNYSTAFWVMGTDSDPKAENNRLSFTDASFSTTTPTDGETVSTKDFNPSIIAGERYEIQMPFEAYIPFVTGIQANGVVMTATADGIEKPFTKDYIQPQPETYKAYYNCINGLVKDKAKRDKAAAAAQQ